MGNCSVRLGIPLGVCIAALGLGSACGGSSKKDPKDATGGVGDTSTTIPKVDPTLCATKGKKVSTFDLNRDNKPDVWKLYETIREGGATLEVLTCKQVDFNRDGRKDYVAAFNRKGGYIFEKFDYDWDGRFDAFRRYDEKTGVVFQVQRDSDFDGKYDITEKYDDGGVLTTVLRDRNGDLTPDVWEQYVNGDLVAILYDDDYDRKVDRREEIKVEKKPATGDTKPAGDDKPAPASDDDKAALK